MIKFKVLMIVVALAHLLSFCLMWLSVEPFYTFFYLLAWWTFILFISALNHLQSRDSLIFDHPHRFFRVFIFSSLIWFFFEAYNFRLENWHYFGAPIEAYIRLPGYFLAYGTVLPGLFETRTLLSQNLFRFPIRGPGIRIQRAILYRFLVIGGLMMIAPLVSPRIFFPLVWVGLIFLLDALLHFLGAGERSISKQAADGDYSELVAFACAGLVCGFLWEFWNFWAGAKWIYSIPRFDFAHVFEMPILGYLGFPFFAVEAYLFYHFLDLIWRRVKRRSVLVSFLAILLALLFSSVVIWGIESETIVTFKIIVAGG